MLLSLIFLLQIRSVFLSSCWSKLTCDSCIQDWNCDWCFVPVLYSSIHCFHVRNESHLCAKDKMYDFQPKPVSSHSANQSFRPAFLTVSLRVNRKFSTSVNYVQPKNYPLDLYYLMDVSATMTKHKTKLSELGNQLAIVMQNLTSDFRLGFGSFVDKNLLPFFEARNHAWLLENCANKTRTTCIRAAYSFENNLSLTNDSRKFSNSVLAVESSGNIDAPESTLEALAQSIVCKNIIGWRNQSTRMIIVSTDDVFHMAGDGKLAGLVDSFNDQCITSDNGTLTNSAVFDYPSIGQVSDLVQRYNIHVVFAVTRSVEKIYRQLSERIRKSSVGILSDDSSNILDIVYNFYSKFTKTLTLDYEKSRLIHMEFEIYCKGNTTANTNMSCNNVQVGDEIRIGIVIKMAKCSTKTFTRFVSFEGSRNILLLNISSHCKCVCDSLKIKELCESAGKVCSNHGTCHCGKCICFNDFYGRYCDMIKPNEGRTCTQLETCIECIQYRNCSRICPIFDLIGELPSYANNYTICNYFNKSNSCIQRFYYDYIKNSLIFELKRNCLVNDRVIIYIIVGIVTIGFAVIIAWKVFVNISDAKEYAKFENEQNRTQWGLEMNPIFKQAINTFNNPLFRTTNAEDNFDTNK